PLKQMEFKKESLNKWFKTNPLKREFKNKGLKTKV
ncbi:hypothetical protein HPHPH3_1164, partial [Helicobacter pylori Hp H-3]